MFWGNDSSSLQYLPRKNIHKERFGPGKPWWLGYILQTYSNWQVTEVTNHIHSQHLNQFCHKSKMRIQFSMKTFLEVCLTKRKQSKSFLGSKRQDNMWRNAISHLGALDICQDPCTFGPFLDSATDVWHF